MGQCTEKVTAHQDTGLLKMGSSIREREEILQKGLWQYSLPYREIKIREMGLNFKMVFNPIER